VALFYWKEEDNLKVKCDYLWTPQVVSVLAIISRKKVKIRWRLKYSAGFGLSEESQQPRKEGSEYERGRRAAIEEAEEKRISENRDVVEERLRENEVRNGHAHTPYFEYDNPTYEIKEAFTSGSPSDEKKHKRKIR